MNWYWWVLIVVVILAAIAVGVYFGLKKTPDVIFYNESDQKGTSIERFLPTSDTVNEFSLHSFDFAVKSVKIIKPNYKIDMVANNGPINDTNPSLVTLTASGNIDEDKSSKFAVITRTA